MTEESLKLEDLSKISVKVTAAQYEGITRTHRDILENVMKDCFAAQTFGELSAGLAAASNRLERLDLLRDIKFIIDTDSSNHDGIVIRVQGKEKRYKVNIGTEFQKNDVALGAGGVFYNIFGRAERLDVNASLGSQSATPLAVNFVKPVGGDPDRLMKVSLLSNLQHYLEGAGNFKNRLHSLGLSYSFASSYRTMHELKYTLDWRHIFAIGSDASATIRRNAGHSLKSSLCHTATYSTLNSLAFPTRGLHARMATELAGFGGNVRFLKNELVCRAYAPLWKELCLYAGTRVGHVAPIAHAWSGEVAPSGTTAKPASLLVIDKFQLGGPLSVRGFGLNSLGPKDRHDSVGGDFSGELGFGCTFPLSSNTKDIVRAHLFSNFGVLTNLNPSLNLWQNAQRLINQASLPLNGSVGIGLQVCLGDAKLEFNVARPLCREKGALVGRGIQVGIGMEFL